MERESHMRKLATVRRVSEVRPIPNADNIELAVVDGWQCVVKKGEFTVGELVIYCEVDTVLPVHPDYEFLRQYGYVQRDWLPNGEGFRLRTLKLRGQVSQGLLLPLSKGFRHDGNCEMWYEGKEVTHLLGAVKWEPPVPAQLAGMAKGSFPSYIPKTYQERVQNLVGVLFTTDLVVDYLWEATLKLDGCSCTFYHRDGEVGACSREINFKLEQEGNVFVDMFHQLDLGTKLPGYGNIAIQGELMGPGIPRSGGNREGLHRCQFYVYDVWDIDGSYYLPKGKRDAIIEALGLLSVPVIHPGATLQELGCDTLEGMLQYADRRSINHEVAEGVVFKNVCGSIGAAPYSFKCISNRYLLREK